jgi:hypothetical protein
MDSALERILDGRRPGLTIGTAWELRKSTDSLTQDSLSPVQDLNA